jgi:hypothetical protein
MINFQNIKRDALGYVYAFVLLFPGMILYLTHTSEYWGGSDPGIIEFMYAVTGFFYCMPISCLLIVLLIIMCIKELFWYLKRKLDIK